jgi:hypothetical protein
VNIVRKRIGVMKTKATSITKTSLEALTAIAKLRRQRRVGRIWLIGDRRVATKTIEALEQKNLVREVAFNGTPALILTDGAKTFLAAEQ